MLIAFIADIPSGLSLGGRAVEISRHSPVLRLGRLSLAQGAPLVTQADPTVNGILIYFSKPGPSVSVEVLNVANCATALEA